MSRHIEEARRRPVERYSRAGLIGCRRVPTPTRA